MPPARLPVAAATTLWMRHRYIQSKVTSRLWSHSNMFVVLSFWMSPTVSPVIPLMICVQSHGSPASLKQPPWPSNWNHNTAPVWNAIRMDQWVSIPNTTMLCDHLVQQRNTVREQETEHAMQNRCDEITQHGQDDTFTDSLDYYTTLRVKHAYLCMNTEGIQRRIAEVEDKINEVTVVVQTADCDIASLWQMPTLNGGEDTSVNLVEDPNTLCTPQAEDYGIP